MRAPRVHRNRGGLAGACGVKQQLSQPGCVAALKVEGLAEYPGLVPTAWVRWAQAIVLDLAEIEDRRAADVSSCGVRTSCLAAFSEYMKGWYSDEPAPSTAELSGGSPHRLAAAN